MCVMESFVERRKVHSVVFPAENVNDKMWQRMENKTRTWHARRRVKQGLHCHLFWLMRLLWFREIQGLPTDFKRWWRFCLEFRPPACTFAPFCSPRFPFSFNRVFPSLYGGESKLCMSIIRNEKCLTLKWKLALYIAIGNLEGDHLHLCGM